MKTLLIVDDDPDFVKGFALCMRKELPQLIVKTSEHGKEAMSIINESPVDMVITDLDMPVMDGFELLTALKESHAKIPIMVLTSFGLTEVQDILSSLGCYLFYRKGTQYHTIIERVKDTILSEAEGYLKGVTLAGLLQLLETERKNCLLSVEDSRQTGQIYLIDGKVVHAKFGSLEGVDAAMQIVCWNNVKINLSKNLAVKKRTIDMKLQDLLLTAFVNHDEGKGNRHEFTN